MIINSRRVQKDDEFLLEVFTPRKRPEAKVGVGAAGGGMFVPFDEYKRKIGFDAKKEVVVEESNRPAEEEVV